MQDSAVTIVCAMQLIIKEALQHASFTEVGHFEEGSVGHNDGNAGE